MLAGAPRLLLFALQRDQPQGSADFAARLQYNLALHQPAGAAAELLYYRANLQPIIRYDDNINAGIPGATLDIGGLPFTINADDRAKAGMVFGLETSLSARLALGPGRTLDVSADAAQAHSFQYDMDVLNAAVSACGAQFMGRARWLEICIGDHFTQRDDRPEQERYTRLTATQLFASGVGLHELRASLQQSWHDDYQQPSVAMQLITARAGLGALSLRIELNPRVKRQNTQLFAASAALTRPIARQPTTLFGSYGYSAGSSLFGKGRRDNVVTAGIARQINRHAEASLRVSQRVSSISTYDDVSVGIDVNLLDLGF